MYCVRYKILQKCIFKNTKRRFARNFTKKKNDVWLFTNSLPKY